MSAATASAAPPATAKRTPAKRQPAPAAPVVVDCKTQKTRLHNDEDVLRARHQLALAECRASSRPDSAGRCDDMKRQQKEQQKAFKEQRKVALGQCKPVKEAHQRASKDQGKRASRSR
jgi:hypothetical protein